MRALKRRQRGMDGFVLAIFLGIGAFGPPSSAQVHYRVDREDGLVITNIPDPSSLKLRLKSGHRPKDTSAFDDLIKTKAGKYELDHNLVKAVVEAESGFNPTAVSPKGAQGLMQLMPGTAAQLGVSDPFDPEQNVEAGTRYLREMLDSFEGSTELALAAYNAGPARVLWYGDIPPFEETRNYVHQVIKKTKERGGKTSSSPSDTTTPAPVDSLGRTNFPSTTVTTAGIADSSASGTRRKVGDAGKESKKPKAARKRPTRIYLISDGQGHIILTNVPVKPGTMN